MQPSPDLEARTKAAIKHLDSGMAGVFDRKSFYEGDRYVADAGHPKLNAGQLCFKYTILAINVLFLIFGCVLMGVGSYAVNNQVGALAGETVPVGLIVLGLFIMLLSLLGAWSAYKESRLALGIYFIFLLLLTIILFIVGISVYVKKDQSEYYIREGWYSADDDIRRTLQGVLDCCGLERFNDTGLGCPDSMGSNPDPATTPTCLSIMVGIFRDDFGTAGACGMAFSIIMLACVVFVCYLMSGIKRKQEEQDIAKLRTGVTLGSGPAGASAGTVSGEEVLETGLDEEDVSVDVEEEEEEEEQPPPRHHHQQQQQQQQQGRPGQGQGAMGQQRGYDGGYPSSHAQQPTARATRRQR